MINSKVDEYAQPINFQAQTKKRTQGLPLPDPSPFHQAWFSKILTLPQISQEFYEGTENEELSANVWYKYDQCPTRFVYYVCLLSKLS